MASSIPYLVVRFEGYFMCRLATDPDPNDEPRGRSGYTMALTTESELDQVIRLQPDEYVDANMRAPAATLNRKVGVTVRSLTFNGQPWNRAPGLIGAAVKLEGRDENFLGPIFESRNNIVGSDDTMAFVVNPFKLAIESQPDLTLKAPRIKLTAVDDLIKDKPEQQIWQIENPEAYDRRLPNAFDDSSLEVMQAISVFDGYAYFRARRAFLAAEIERQDDDRKTANTVEAARDAELKMEQAKSRLYQLEFWGDRVINKLGFRLQWEFPINGTKSASGELGGNAHLDQRWPVSFWFGGWDGDLLIGYMRGSLSIPFEPA
jgi:hypothetical protein